MDTVVSGVDRRWRVMVVKIGRVTSAVMAIYSVQLELVRRFDPEGIILHVGHNDLVGCSGLLI